MSLYNLSGAAWRMSERRRIRSSEVTHVAEAAVQEFIQVRLVFYLIKMHDMRGGLLGTNGDLVSRLDLIDLLIQFVKQAR